MRVHLWFATAALLAFTNAFAHGEGAGQPAGGGENLTVTVELSRSSPDLRLLTQPEVDSATVDGVVRLRVPLASGRLAGLSLADVGGDPITVGDFRRALLPAEEDEAEGPFTPRMKNPMELLERLVNIRLVAREAREIGLDEIPEIRNLVDVFSRRTLREHLIQRATKGVEADEAEAEKLYREAILEWRIKALLFKDEKDAAAFRDAVLAGAAFDAAGGKYISEGKARAEGGGEGAFMKSKDISREMAEKIGALAPGSVSEVIPTKDRFAVIRLEEVRMPESAEARADAKRRARNFAQNTALVAYFRELNDRYVKIDRELFENLDFGGTVENFERMREDGRVVARVEGEESVTVSQLAQGIREQYYHGMGKAIEDGTINEKKAPVLTDILYKRFTLKEAKALGLDRTPEFIGAVSDYENSVLFGTFVEKVLRPDIKISPEDLREYYEKHLEEYSYPEMVKLRSLSFQSSSAAQTALGKLRKGTDFHWMKANGEGQVPSEDAEATRFTNELVTVRSLPEGIRQVLEGAGEGSFVLYRQSETYFHVLNIEKRILSRPQPFEDARSDVLTKVYKEKIDKTLKDWIVRLRNAYGAKVYAVGFGGSAP